MLLRGSGKRVAAMLLSGGDKEYLVATGADRIWVAPQSFLAINGLAANVIFLGDTMHKLGIKWDVARVGAYKNAPDQLTRASMSREQRESLDAFLDVESRRYEALVTESRHITAPQFRKVLEEGLLPPALAVREKLADDVVDPAQLDRAAAAPGARRPLGRAVLAASARAPLGRAAPHRRGAGDRAPSPAGRAGAIRSASRARPGRRPSSARCATPSPTRSLRPSSSGWTAAAATAWRSDIMYRSVLRARTRKPVVATMGDAAASGGYYAAMGADWVLAEPTTLTGSIGVFVLKPALEGLGKKLGINVETLKRGPLADILGLYSPWTPAEQAAAQRWVDAFYDDFVDEVARSRQMTPAQVDAVARGRIWSGEDAKARGLVDALGGLPEAIAEARRRAGVPEGRS